MSNFIGKSDVDDINDRPLSIEDEFREGVKNNDQNLKLVLRHYEAYFSCLDETDKGYVRESLRNIAEQLNEVHKTNKLFEKVSKLNTLLNLVVTALPTQSTRNHIVSVVNYSVFSIQY